MARILRGDVVWAELDPVRGHEQGGRRPVVVISSDEFNGRSGTVIAMAITSQEPRGGLPLNLELTSVRMPKRSWVKVSQIRTLAVERIGIRLGRVSEDEMQQLIDGLNRVVAK
ncbi:MAG: type II toxin-antitoxin system PemK/MazF family toxin [Planctomycetia bacterium]|nr:type II toxin-antitoxin system PemK/MazF family toxin [Planctomycetia bacterium]